MNTVFLVIWFTVNGNHAMVQQPVAAAQCDAVYRSLTLPAGSSWACATAEQAAFSIAQDECRLVDRSDSGGDNYVCKGRP